MGRIRPHHHWEGPCAGKSCDVAVSAHGVAGGIQVFTQPFDDSLPTLSPPEATSAQPSALGSQHGCSPAVRLLCA